MDKLKLLPRQTYRGLEAFDPVRFYFWPLIGNLYRRRVELCLYECRPGDRVLEIGFGSGISFLNLQEKFGEIHGLDLTARVDEVSQTFQSRGIATNLRNGDVLCMPYQDRFFDTILLVSILEHLLPSQQETAFAEMARVLKPGGQVVYGVPIESPLMVVAFRLLGYDIRKHHFSSPSQVATAAGRHLQLVRHVHMKSAIPFLRPVYLVGHYAKS